MGGCGGYVVGGCGGYVVGGCGGYVVVYSDNNATSWLILQDRTCQIFSLAEISR